MIVNEIFGPIKDDLRRNEVYMSNRPQLEARFGPLAVSSWRNWFKSQRKLDGARAQRAQEATGADADSLQKLTVEQELRRIMIEGDESDKGTGESKTSESPAPTATSATSAQGRRIRGGERRGNGAEKGSTASPSVGRGTGAGRGSASGVVREICAEDEHDDGNDRDTTQWRTATGKGKARQLAPAGRTTFQANGGDAGGGAGTRPRARARARAAEGHEDSDDDDEEEGSEIDDDEGGAESAMQEGGDRDALNESRVVATGVDNTGKGGVVRRRGGGGKPGSDGDGDDGGETSGKKKRGTKRGAREVSDPFKEQLRLQKRILAQNVRNGEMLAKLIEHLGNNPPTNPEVAKQQQALSVVKVMMEAHSNTHVPIQFTQQQFDTAFAAALSLD